MKRTAELQFFDFADLGVLPEAPAGVRLEVLRAGELRSNNKTTQRANAAMYVKDYAQDEPLDSIVEDYLGCWRGADGIRSAMSALNAQQAFLRVHLPVLSSEKNQDDVLSAASMEQLVRAGLNLDFWFV